MNNWLNTQKNIEFERHEREEKARVQRELRVENDESHGKRARRQR